MIKVNISIDGNKYVAKKWENILHFALKHWVEIPHFCYHEDLAPKASCRICLVEVDWDIHMSCNLKAHEWLSIKTESAKIKKLRKINLELLLSGHRENCGDCRWGSLCKTWKLMKWLKISSDKFTKDRLHGKCHKMSVALKLDPKLCINCNRCSLKCSQIWINYLKLEDTSSRTRMSYNKDPDIDCIYCWQCSVVCPVWAIQEQEHISSLKKILNNTKKIIYSHLNLYF